MMIPQQKSKGYMPEELGLRLPQRKARPMDKVQCGLLILGIEMSLFVSRLFFSVKTVNILHLLSFIYCNSNDNARE